jgi:hypothetical protein
MSIVGNFLAVKTNDRRHSELKLQNNEHKEAKLTFVRTSILADYFGFSWHMSLCVAQSFFWHACEQYRVFMQREQSKSFSMISAR